MVSPNLEPPSEPMEERLRRLEAQLRELQEREARQPRSLLEQLVPPEVRTHLRAAQRERLLAARAWLDAAIKRTEEQPERPRRVESVRIE